MSENTSPKRARLAHEESSSEEEWDGIQPEGSTNISDLDGNSEFGESGTWIYDEPGNLLPDHVIDFEHDGFTAGSFSPTDEKTVVFSENKFLLPEAISKAEMKAFMVSPRWPPVRFDIWQIYLVIQGL